MIVLNLPALIAIAVLYLLVFPLGALLCRYVTIKITITVNVILGIMAIIFIYVSAVDIYYCDEVFLTFVPVYIYIPNLILYFNMRKKCKRNNEKKKYTFKRNAGMTAILAACYFPFFYFCLTLMMVMY